MKHQEVERTKTLVARHKAIREGFYCEHGEHPDEGPLVPAVGYVHVETPTDMGTWNIGPEGVKQVRPPDGKKPDYYHLAMCAEHIVGFSNSLCDCAVPGKWPLQVAEERYQLLELRNANRNLLPTVAGILFTPTADSSSQSIPNALRKANEIIAAVDEHRLNSPALIAPNGGITPIDQSRPEIAKLAATIFATKTPKSSERQDVENAVRWATLLWLASQLPQSLWDYAPAGAVEPPAF